MGWVADEVARRVIKEQPEAFGQGEDGMGARLDDLQKQHRALLEARGRQLRGELATVTGMAKGKESGAGWLDRDGRATRGRTQVSKGGAKTDSVSTVGIGDTRSTDSGSEDGNGSSDGGDGGGGAWVVRSAVGMAVAAWKVTAKAVALWLVEMRMGQAVVEAAVRGEIVLAVAVWGLRVVIWAAGLRAAAVVEGA